jgi:hypothetical protein
MVGGVVHKSLAAVDGDVDDRLHDGIDDLAAVHADTDFIADFKLPWVGLGFLGTARLYDI